MSNRLHVGNLPFHATEDLIKQAFERCGDVTEVSVVVDRVTGRSRGFAFVEMASEDAARKAIADLDGQDLGGRPMRVSAAEARRERGPGGPRGGGGGGFDRGGDRGGRGGGGGGGGGGRGRW